MKIKEVVCGTLNINGGGANHLRRIQVKNLVFQKHIDICLLQETHITETAQPEWLRPNKGQCFFSNLSSVSMGVAFLLRPGFVPDSCNFHEIVKGHLASLELVYRGFHLTLLNVYAPSSSVARNDFFIRLANYLHTIPFDHCVCIGGDFNCTFEPNLDRNTREPHPEAHKDISLFHITWSA